MNAIAMTADGRVQLFGSAGLCGETALTGPYFAVGAGAEIAMGALHMGASAIQAVNAACECSPYCGGPIDYIDGAMEIRTVRTGSLEPEQPRIDVATLPDADRDWSGLVVGAPVTIAPEGACGRDGLPLRSVAVCVLCGRHWSFNQQGDRMLALCNQPLSCTCKATLILVDLPPLRGYVSSRRLQAQLQELLAIGRDWSASGGNAGLLAALSGFCPRGIPLAHAPDP